MESASGFAKQKIFGDHRSIDERDDRIMSSNDSSIPVNNYFERIIGHDSILKESTF